LRRASARLGVIAVPTGSGTEVPRKPKLAPHVSILKPVRGADPELYWALRSNLEQDYPDFEMLLGVSNPNDASLPIIERIVREYPNRARFFQTATPLANRKIGVLAELSRHAAGEIILIADGDIAVPPGYLRAVVAPLAGERTGLVTCAYRARAEDWPGRFEALGVATDFAPSTMVAPFVGVDEFALGSTIAVRRRDLDRIGGIEAVADYLADDYQLGKMIHSLGFRCVLSEVIVETHLSGASWTGVWRHQVRWARTIRVSRGGAYWGLPVTQATTCAVLAAAAGLWWQAAALMMIRLVTAFTAGWLVMRSSDVLKLWWLIPLRDLSASAVWGVGLFGSTVEWGGETLCLTSDGRIIR
jgi:ceramide glucosyltransferase